MRPASSVPPVIEAMTIGARSVLPKSVTERSTSDSFMSGSASCTRCTHSSSVEARVEADVLLGAEREVVRLALADGRHRGERSLLPAAFESRAPGVHILFKET